MIRNRICLLREIYLARGVIESLDYSTLLLITAITAIHLFYSFNYCVLDVAECVYESWYNPWYCTFEYLMWRTYIRKRRYGQLKIVAEIFSVTFDLIVNLISLLRIGKINDWINTTNFSKRHFHLYINLTDGCLSSSASALPYRCRERMCRVRCSGAFENRPRSSFVVVAVYLELI